MLLCRLNQLGLQLLHLSLQLLDLKLLLSLILFHYLDCFSQCVNLVLLTSFQKCDILAYVGLHTKHRRSNVSVTVITEIHVQAS